MVDKSECVEWGGYKDRDGYGRKGIDGRVCSTHRLALAWALWDGKEDWKEAVPKGQPVLHHCDNPACCNPDHLYLGSAADNARDMAIRGRSCRGESKHTSRLTSADVLKIRSARGQVTARQLGARYGVHRKTIEKIWQRERWAWLH